MYDPKQYWELRENPNAAGHEYAPKWMEDFLITNIPPQGNILELGPGIGRLLHIYKPSHQVTTLDLSRRYQDVLAKKAKSLRLDISQWFLEKPSDNFPFDAKSFDLGIAVQVLMHIPKQHINHTMRELLRTCDKVLIVATSDHRRKVAHVFCHDYRTIVNEIDGIIRKYQEVGNTTLFAYTRKGTTSS